MGRYLRDMSRFIHMIPDNTRIVETQKLLSEAHNEMLQTWLKQGGTVSASGELLTGQYSPHGGKTAAGCSAEYVPRSAEGVG